MPEAPAQGIPDSAPQGIQKISRTAAFCRVRPLAGHAPDYGCRPQDKLLYRRLFAGKAKRRPTDLNCWIRMDSSRVHYPLQVRTHLFLWNMMLIGDLPKSVRAGKKISPRTESRAGIFYRVILCRIHRSLLQEREGSAVAPLGEEPAASWRQGRFPVRW